MRPTGEALVARVIALIIRRHGGGIIVAPHQTGALTLLLDVPADELGAALGHDLRILMAIACGPQPRRFRRPPAAPPPSTLPPRLPRTYTHPPTPSRSHC